MGTTTRWTLSPAGQELYRLLALMTRIVARAADLAPSNGPGERELVLSQTLAALDDPVVRRILRHLITVDGVGPVELEAACRPFPRRTVYRRLGPLVDAGAVERTVTGQVPRTTTYAIRERWRPVASIVLLSTWWATRHRAASGDTELTDLEGLLLSVLPLVRPASLPANTEVDWTVTDHDRTRRIRVSVRDHSVTLSGTPGVEASAELVADSRGWASALVTGNRDELTVHGDENASLAVLTAFRGALLSYIR